MNPYYEYFEAMRGNGNVGNIGDIYESINYQSGYGMDDYWEGQDGSGLKEWIQPFMPFVKKGLTYLGKQAVTAVTDTVKDSIMGENVGVAAKNRFGEAGKRVWDEIPEALSQLGSSSEDYMTDEPIRKRPSATSVSNRGGSRKKKRRLIARYPGLRRF